MLRLTGGEFRGRMIRTPTQQSTRPTQAMLRQALFNSIQTLISSARVVDLFAGSGALGFEALSRGAERVTFVENAGGAVKCIQQNMQDLGVEDRAELISEPVDKASAAWLNAAPYDVVLADPPYGKGWEEKLLHQLPWARILSESGVFCLEWSPQARKSKDAGGLPDELPFLVKIREKNYGDSVLTHYQRRTP